MNHEGRESDFSETEMADASAHRRAWGLLDMTLDGIVLLDAKGRILDANRPAIEFLRTSVSAMSGRDFWHVVPQEIAAKHQEACEKALESVPLYRFIAHRNSENGRVEYTLRKHPKGYVINLREAGSTQRLQRKLEDGKRYNQLIFEANPNVMWLFNRATLRIFAVNQAAVAFYGIAHDVFVTLGMQSLFPEGEGTELLDSLRLSTDDYDTPPEMRLCRQTKRDGTKVLVELAWSHIKWEGDDAVLVSVADVSARHLADNNLKIANAELTQALIVQKDELRTVRQDLLAFTQAVSVDLQDSLHVAHGFAFRLAEKYSPRLDEEGQRYIRRIQASITQLARLFDDLRTLAQLPLRPSAVETVDLAWVSKMLIAALQAKDASRQVTIEIADRLLVTGYKASLTTAMACLLDNAWKFTSKNPDAWIKVGLLQGKADGELILVVADNGVGFDPAYGGNLFTAFQRLHSSADFPGNGLGLAIIKRVAQIHGGKVWAESSDKVGASFFMSLPQSSMTAA